MVYYVYLYLGVLENGSFEILGVRVMLYDLLSDVQRKVICFVAEFGRMAWNIDWAHQYCLERRRMFLLVLYLYYLLMYY